MVLVKCCSAVALALLFARKEGQVEHPYLQGAAKRSPHQAASGLPGGSGAAWRHGVAGGVHNTHPQLPVSWELLVLAWELVAGPGGGNREKH